MLKLPAKGMDLQSTLECGQCFRWVERADAHGVYDGTVNEHPATVYKQGDYLMVDSPNKNEQFWIDYFDLARDYNEIIDKVSISPLMKKAAQQGCGIRILKQDKWETLCSFIISQNNNIPRIKGIINRLTGGGAFPRPGDLRNKDLSHIRAGFREKYILDAAEKCAQGSAFLETASKLETSLLREKLKTIKGVGDKVADCVMLFAYQRFEVFPKDVWIKRVTAEHGDEFSPEMFGEYAGFAQQYIYHYFRNLGGIGGAA